MTPPIVHVHITTCQFVHWELALTLMNELVEGMLAVSTGLSPHNRSSGVVHTSPLAGHRLPVGLHVPLSSSTVQIRYKSHDKIVPTFNLVYLCTIWYPHLHFE